MSSPILNTIEYLFLQLYLLLRMEGKPTPKVPYPRQLTKKESLDSLSHWQTSVRNYFRRFP